MCICSDLDLNMHAMSCHLAQQRIYFRLVHDRLQSQELIPSLTNGLSGCQCVLRIRIGRRGTNQQLKVPSPGCEDCGFQTWPTQLLPSSPLRLSTSLHTHIALSRSHASTHSHTFTHTDCWTGCAAGDFQGVPPGLQAIPSPPRPRPLSPSGRDDRLIIIMLLLQHEIRARPARPSQSTDTHTAVRGTGGRSQPPRVSPTAPRPQARTHLRDGLD